MAMWDPESMTGDDLAFRLVQNGFVTMFWRVDLLDTTLDWLREEAYELAEFDSSGWLSDADMFDALASRFQFPDYFGRNFAALDDCIGDVVLGHYGWDPQATGLVVVLRSFDQFAGRSRRAAQILLSIMADQARSGALVGHRVLCLLQSDDPRLAFDPVGATPVTWNLTEWLDSKRGL